MARREQTYDIESAGIERDTSRVDHEIGNARVLDIVQELGS
jgi:hypothetical protein